jgi:hypothetical protein
MSDPNVVCVLEMFTPLDPKEANPLNKRRKRSEVVPAIKNNRFKESLHFAKGSKLLRIFLANPIPELRETRLCLRRDVISSVEISLATRVSAMLDAMIMVTFYLGLYDNSKRFHKRAETAWFFNSVEDRRNFRPSTLLACRFFSPGSQNLSGARTQRRGPRCRR